ncbi:hypothetical protein ONZ43_g6540 [Nemania bipapillata]|uniref:Uncharacterized protein n=1 Tax=Nemania bipapillata TaxID=110536 RepID=A0ACC2HZ48_9PEZI|nr:hypothetical protein ONZ43_g6540 [Nemania bipapillata]
MSSPDPPVAPGSPTAKFQDFDHIEVFQKAVPHAENIDSQNFVVEFGPERARIGFDLGASDIESLLKSERDVQNYPIRWIHHVTHGGPEKGTVLLGLLAAMETLNLDSPLATLPKDDIEMAEMDDDSMELYLQVKNTVNYFSTDQTPKALCIGAHWLHRRPIGDYEHEHKSMMPPKHWQWLTLCNDHTVLSIHEEPSLEDVPEKEDRQKWERMSFANGSEPISLADEGTSNLFYYLFEDYVAAGPLKTAERKLEHITTRVLESGRPQIRNKTRDIIPTLHYLSRDLRELKHLFENYKNLISKITALGKADAQVPNGHVEDARRVMLTDTALSRFERLGDRLQYLMLNSIEGYLLEINAVSSTYFNLTQQKDSEATARLTRSATLLAKLSVFFLPISFLTSYFSVQVEDLYEHWHGTDYWYSFAVIASVSFVSLFFFSRLLMFFSDTLDAWASHIMVWFRKVWRAMGFNVHDEDEE